MKGKSDRELENIAEASRISLRRMHEISSAYYHYAKRNGVPIHAYVEMYRHYNPLYGAYGPEIADRVYKSFSRKRNGFLDFDEFLSSILFADELLQNFILPSSPLPIEERQIIFEGLPQPQQPIIITDQIMPLAQFPREIRYSQPQQPLVISDQIMPLAQFPREIRYSQPLHHHISHAKQLPVVREDVFHLPEPQQQVSNYLVNPAFNQQQEQNQLSHNCDRNIAYCSKTLQVPANELPDPVRITINIQPCNE